jgi:tetratricopeptide (TPR) repeat protein
MASLAGVLANGPTPVTDAISACEELLTEADRNGQASIMSILGALEAMQGAFERARGRITMARAIYAELGQSLAAEYTCGTTESQVELLAGDLERAQSALERSYAVLKQHGERSYLATRAAMLADVLCRRGRWEEAKTHVSAAQSGSVADDVATEWLWRSVEAKLQARVGRQDRALQLASEALAILTDTDALNHQAACRLDLAEVHRLGGDPAQAATTIEEAIELFERKGNEAAAAQSRSLLAVSAESS